MKYRIVVLGAFLVAVAISLNTSAMAAQEKQQVLSGEVMKVDVAGRKVTLQRTNGYKTKEISMIVAPDAQITRGAEKIPLEKLAAGQRVTANVSREKGVVTAHLITLQPAAVQSPTGSGSKKG